jgi:hypothetical protein
VTTDKGDDLSLLSSDAAGDELDGLSVPAGFVYF